MDPTKHLISTKKHAKMMIGLGFKGGLRNYATYLLRLENSKRWNKLNRISSRAANRRYYDKIEAEFGTRSVLNRPLYAMNHAAEKLQKRKDRANEARKELLRLQNLWPNRRGGGSKSPITINAKTSNSTA